MNIKTIIAAIMLIMMPALTFAQSDKSNEELSKNLKSEIEILSAEIKTLKAKLKADPTNSDIIAEKTAKEAELKIAKDRKKTIDTAISANKSHEKQTQDAEKAKNKMESASKSADALKAKHSSMAGKSNELISDELDANIDIMKSEVKNLKARKKLNPKDATIDAIIKKKEIEIRETKRQLKIINTAIKTEKTSKKEAKAAEKTKKKAEKASQKADEVKDNM